MTDYEREEPTRPCARDDDDRRPPLPAKAIARGIADEITRRTQRQKGTAMSTSKTPAAVILIAVATIASILQSPIVAGHPQLHAALEALAGILTIVATVFAKPLTGANATTSTVTTTVTADPTPPAQVVVVDARTKQ